MSFSANIDDLVAENRNGLLGKKKSWSRVRLKKIATILNGFPFESAKFKKESGTPLIRIRDILPGRTETFYDGDFDPAFLVQRGEILIGMDGDFNCKEWTGEPALLNQRVCKITPDTNLFSKQFLKYVLPGYLSAINAETSSVTVKHLSSRTIGDIPLPLPPLDEQRAIVAEIEQQFTRLEAGVEALKRVQGNLKRYRAAVLKAACEGKLVPTEAELAKKKPETGNLKPEFETGEQLLQRILTERRKNWTGRGKYKEPAAPDTTNLPKLPKGWIYASVEQLGIVGEQAVLTGPFGTNLGRNDFTDDGVPVLTISCLKDTGIHLDNADFVSAKKAEELERYRLCPGDLLFSRMASVGRAGIVGEALRGALINYHIMRLRLEPSVLLAKYYMSYVRGSAQVEAYLREVNHGATRAGINTEQLLNRFDRTETERFKCFSYEDLLKRDKVNLDIFWLKDEALEDSANLPAPEVIAADITEDLEAALEQFATIAEDLKG
jgi:type I restriction enzyme S subunit